MERTFIEQQKERLLTLRQEMTEKVEQVQEKVAHGLAPSDATDQEEVFAHIFAAKLKSEPFFKVARSLKVCYSTKCLRSSYHPKGLRVVET